MDKFSIAVPNGTMKERIQELFRDSGNPIVEEKGRKNIGRVERNILVREISFQRPQEIPLLVEKGYFDIGITGQDWLVESGIGLPVLLTIPISAKQNQPPKLVLAAPPYTQLISNLSEECVIATEYPRITKWFMRNIGRPRAQIWKSYGNTENKIRFGANAIVDIVDSGESLKDNGLEVLAQIIESKLVVISRPNLVYVADAFCSDLYRCLAKQGLATDYFYLSQSF